MSIYAKRIKSLLDRFDRSDIDPRHVEGYLRLTYRTLDHLSDKRISREIPDIVAAIDEDPRIAEENALSYGLRRRKIKQ